MRQRPEHIPKDEWRRMCKKEYETKRRAKRKADKHLTAPNLETWREIRLLLECLKLQQLQTDSKAQALVVLVHNLQVKIDELRKEYRTAINAIHNLVYDPETRRLDETERVAHAISNAKPGATS